MTVIASEAKQSRLLGLLRRYAPRNDTKGVPKLDIESYDCSIISFILFIFSCECLLISSSACSLLYFAFSSISKSCSHVISIPLSTLLYVHFRCIYLNGNFGSSLSAVQI